RIKNWHAPASIATGARRIYARLESADSKARAHMPREKTREDTMRAMIMAVIAATSIIGAGSWASAAELISFKVGEAAPAHTFLAIWMAQAARPYQAPRLQRASA